MKQFQLFPDLCFERDDVAAVEVAVVTVLFADVGAVGDLLGVGFGLEAEMVGAGIGGTDQAGEVEEREVCGFARCPCQYALEAPYPISPKKL